MALSAGTRLGPYEILEPLGAGGMGEVYRARDPRLKREVALKVLPAELASESERLERFQREAETLGALNHPHIVTIHTVEEADDLHFLTMELVEGRTLSKVIPRGGLPLARFFRIAIPLTEAISAAHDKGITHRDLKPGNVMVAEEDRVKVLDFGLAKLRHGAEAIADSEAPTSPATDSGRVVGTAPYMSPEQALGDDLDARTDLFSLGAVLYEMATGRQAFTGSGFASTLDAILHRLPTPLVTLNPEVPTELSRIIDRALEKDRDLRYQSASDLRADLLRLIRDSDLGRAAPHRAVEDGRPGDRKSIVVLPFQNISADPEQEYFCDGMTEEIITDLSKIGSLCVISRNSAMTLKGTRKDTQAIGRQLAVQYVLEGSVRKAGNSLRITAQLIDARTDVHLWAEKYSGTLDDVFEIQEKVSRSIVDALELKLSAQERAGLTDRPVGNPQAYECYLRAMRELNSMSESGLRRALRDLKNGLDLVGDDADLYFGLGQAYVFTHDLGIEPTEATLQEAETCAKKLLEMEPGSSRGHYLMGHIARFRGDVLEGIRHFERVLAVDPNSRETLLNLGLYYGLAAGQPRPALQLVNRLLEIDPLTPTSHLAHGFVLWMNGQLNQALGAFEKMEMLEPESILPRVWTVIVLLWRGQHQQAFDLIDETTRQQPTDVMQANFCELLSFTKLAFQRKRQQAASTLSDRVRHYLWVDPDLPWLMGGLFAVMDDKEEAFRWLERSIDNGYMNYPLFAERDPFYENLRGEERFQSLMDEIRRKWERFEAGADVSRHPVANAQASS